MNNTINSGRRRSIVAIAAIIVVAAVIALASMIPLSSDAARTRVIASLAQRLDGEVELRELRLSVFPV